MGLDLDIDLTTYAVDPDTGCWLWTGSIHKRTGYAMCGPRRRLLAHRVAYERYVGPIPEGLHIDHVYERGCRHRHCINTAHLEAVTRKTNILRGMGITAQQARRTHCIRGHALAGENLRVYGGKRQCFTCHRARNSKSYRARASALSDN